MAITLQKCDVKSIEVPSDVKGFLRHILGMSALDLQIYYELCNRGSSTVEDLSELIGKDKSTIYKSLKHLVDNGFVRREVRILRKGGYKYIFTPAPPQELRSIIMERMNSCFRQIMAFIELSSML